MTWRVLTEPVLNRGGARRRDVSLRARQVSMISCRNECRPPSYSRPARVCTMPSPKYKAYDGNVGVGLWARRTGISIEKHKGGSVRRLLVEPWKRCVWQAPHRDEL